MSIGNLSGRGGYLLISQGRDISRPYVRLQACTISGVEVPVRPAPRA